MDKTAIRDFYGKILGWIETDAEGNKTARDFYGKILGYYKKRYDHTTDFYGKVLSNGDTVVSLIYAENN